MNVSRWSRPLFIGCIISLMFVQTAFAKPFSSSLNNSLKTHNSINVSHSTQTTTAMGTTVSPIPEGNNLQTFNLTLDNVPISITTPFLPSSNFSDLDSSSLIATSSRIHPYQNFQF